MMLAKSKFSDALLFIVPAAVLLLLYSVYDFSLQSIVTFAIYTVLGLISFIACLFCSGNIKKLLIPFAVFEATYLSVYTISISMHLNTSWFDFSKGVAFSLIVFSLVMELKLLISGSIKIKILSHVLLWLLIFVSLFLPMVVICYLIATGSLISSDIILALAQTNATEGQEFFISNFNSKWVISFAVLIAVITINFYLFAFSTPDITTEKKSILLSCVAVGIISVFLALPRMDYLPFSVIKVTSKQLDNFDRYKKQKQERLDKLAKLSSLKLRDQNPGNLYVLVIGESQNRDRMHAYGYERENTPKLDLRIKDPNTILFKNSYSSWPQTVQALSYALTQSNQYQNTNVADGYSLMEIARASGFTTYWMSNQRKFGVYETPITVIASTADHEVWTNGSSKMEGVFFDEELLNRFPELDDRRNNFVVIHLMGSHQKYDKRLPSAFKKFNGTTVNEDDYDNTILYTDYVLDRIYEKVSSYPSFKALIYMSDHGEDPNIVGGHDPVNVNSKMLRIPLTISFSDEYVKHNGRIVSELKRNKDKYWSNDLLFETVVSVIGIEGIPDFKSEYSLASTDYLFDKKDVLTMGGKEPIEKYEK
ncbi:MAG: phosphoethanolamine transferase [Succinivibrio sp.]